MPEAIARHTAEHGGDVLALKGDQATMYEEVRLFLDNAINHDFKATPHDFHHETESGDGCIETRRMWVSPAVDWCRDCEHVPAGQPQVVAEQQRIAEQLDHRPVKIGDKVGKGGEVYFLTIMSY